MARFNTLVLAICLFLFEHKVTGQSDYYPLAEGARYTYEVKAMQQSPSALAQEQTLSAIIVHLGSAIVQGKTVTPEGRYIDGKLAGVAFVADDETGIYYFANQNATEKKPVVMNPIQYLIKYPVQTGAGWKQQSSGFELVHGKKLPVSLDVFVESEDETVMVPAGVFVKCLKIRMTGKVLPSKDGPEFRMDNQLWYAPGMGMIKQIQKEERVSPNPLTFTMVLNLQEISHGNL